MISDSDDVLSIVPGSNDPTERIDWSDLNDQINEINDLWSQDQIDNSFSSEGHKCYCSMQTLMTHGCKCGGN